MVDSGRPWAQPWPEEIPQNSRAAWSNFPSYSEHLYNFTLSTSQCDNIYLICFFKLTHFFS